MVATDWQAIGAVGSAVAAVGALAVVILTVALARSAQRSANAAVDAATGAWRPVLVPHRLKVVHTSRSVADTTVEVRNVGRGPTLEIRMTLNGRGGAFDRYPAYIAPPDARIEYGGLTIPSISTSCDVVVTYCDIAGRGYVSRARAQLRQPQRPPGSGASVEIEGFLTELRFERSRSSK